MAQNSDISQYFSKDTVTNLVPFFDKIEPPEECSTSGVNRENYDSLKNSVENCDEPTLCKLFQSSSVSSNNSSSKRTEADPGNFFDMIGSIDNDLIQATVDEPNISSDSQEGDVLNSFKTVNNNFSKTVRITESERSRDAWIIPDSARRELIKMATSPPGSYIVSPDFLTMPGVILEEDLKDTVYEAVCHYLGEGEAAKRKVLTTAEVTQDDRGIRDLIQAGCYRAAVNLTKTMLTMYGQGAGRAGHPSKHTVRSIQLWFTRLALLVKLKSFPLAHDESEPFGDLDKPDMFFQFYPELYGGRSGSIVPFSLRLLIAQIPAFIEKHQLTLTRLYGILATVRKILSNLDNGLFEDGSPCAITSEAREESIRLWTNRETRVLHALVSCSVAFKDYTLAIEIMNTLCKREKDPEQLKCLQSAFGRILLQLGDIVSAEKYFALSRSNMKTAGVRNLIDFGLASLAQNQFQEAYIFFQKASDLEPKNITAINNMSVCLLYQGKMKQAVNLLEEVIQKYPKLALHESLILNLCTLYELQSSFYSNAKLKLLMLVNQNKGDGFNVGCLKLP